MEENKKYTTKDILRIIFGIAVVIFIFSLSNVFSDDDSSSPSKNDTARTTASSLLTIETTQTTKSTTSCETTKKVETTTSSVPVEDVTQYDFVSTTTKIGFDYFDDPYLQCVSVIQNTGEVPIYISSCKFDIETSDGELVDVMGAEVYPNIIVPGEKAIVYDVSSFDKYDPAKEYVALPHVNYKKSTTTLEYLKISSFSISENSYGYIECVGRVENTTDKEQTLYMVVIFLYDDNGNILDLAYTYPEYITPGEKTSFDITFMYNYFDFDLDDVARYKAIAYPIKFQF